MGSQSISKESTHETHVLVKKKKTSKKGKIILYLFSFLKFEVNA
jgi:hypothetical protein